MKQKLLLIALVLIAAASKAQLSENSYAIRNVATGKVLRIEDANTQDGTPIVAYSPVNWKCVTWDCKRESDGLYQLVNLYSGKTMQAGNDGRSLEEQPVKEGDKKQQYEFVKVEKGQYLIRLAGTDLFITAPSDNSNSSLIKLTPKNNSALQLWTLKEQHPTL